MPYLSLLWTCYLSLRILFDFKLRQIAEVICETVDSLFQTEEFTKSKNIGKGCNPKDEQKETENINY